MKIAGGLIDGSLELNNPVIFSLTWSSLAYDAYVDMNDWNPFWVNPSSGLRESNPYYVGTASIASSGLPEDVFLTAVTGGAYLLHRAPSAAARTFGDDIIEATLRSFDNIVDNAAGASVPSGRFYSVAYEMTLSPNSYPGVSRYMHFKEANIALDAAMQSNPLLGRLGISVPRSDSGSITGKSPGGWVWHHNTRTGVMQLVPKSQHPSVPGGIFWEVMHPDGVGGYSMWGK